MNKEQIANRKLATIQKLTWKYFWKQKWEELCRGFKVIFIILAFLVIIYSTVFAVVYIIHIVLPAWFETDPMWEYENILRINCIINIVGWVYFGLYKWFSSNWEKAKKKAMREVGK